MPKKDRGLDPKVERAAVGLRVAGMSERTIYEGLREVLAKDVPSYRDLRAAYSRAGVRYREQADQARREGRYPEDGVRERPLSVTYYLQNREAVREVDRTKDALESFDEKYLLGFLARQHIAPDEIDDFDPNDPEKGFAGRLGSIYETGGS